MKLEKQNFSLHLDDVDGMSEMGKALSSPVRIQILTLLKQQSMTMSELATNLYVSPSSISMHIKILQDVGLVTVIPKPGQHGAQKLCGISVDRILFDFFDTSKTNSITPATIFNIPIGNYVKAAVNSPCGLVNKDEYVDIEDSPYAFYELGHKNAQLIWFYSGYLEYHITNKHFVNDNVKNINISFEVCSEAPGYCNDWPSDVFLEVNNKRLTTFRISGDYGGKRGIHNPPWWSDSNTQYGELKLLTIDNEGSYLDGQLISDYNLESLKLNENYYFSLALGVDKDSEFVGGLNIFGKHFGNYAQDIRIEIQYLK